MLVSSNSRRSLREVFGRKLQVGSIGPLSLDPTTLSFDFSPTAPPTPSPAPPTFDPSENTSNDDPTEPPLVPDDGPLPVGVTGTVAGVSSTASASMIAMIATLSIAGVFVVAAVVARRAAKNKASDHSQGSVSDDSSVQSSSNVTGQVEI